MNWAPDRYDSFHKNYQLQYGLDLISKLESQVNLRGKTILDLGCGNSDLTLTLKSRVGDRGRVIAVDRDGEMLNSLRMKRGSEMLEIHQSDIIAWLQSTTQQYDIIFSNAVLHWLNSHEAFAEILKGVHRCLLPSGYFASRFSLQGNAQAAKEFLEKHLRNYTDNAELVLRRSIFQFERCLEYFNEQGFRVIVSEEVNYSPFENRELSFQWMVNSQPLLAYLEKEELESFEKLLWQEWQVEEIAVSSHHGLFLVQKV